MPIKALFTQAPFIQARLIHAMPVRCISRKGISRKGIAITLAGLLLAGCAATPVIEGPANAPTPAIAPVTEASTLTLPINLSLDALRDEVLRNLPSPLARGSTRQQVEVKQAAPDAQACQTMLDCLGQRASRLASSLTLPVDADLQYKVYLQSLDIRLEGTKLTSVATLDFSVASQLVAGQHALGLASCGIREPMAEVEFTLPGNLGWAAGGELSVQPGQWLMRWRRPCNITAFNINLESLLNLPLIRDSVSRRINEQLKLALNRIDLKPMLAQAWPELQKPRELHPGLWLQLRPESLSFGPLTGTGKQASFVASLTTRPLLLSAASAPEWAATALPAISTTVPAGNGFHIALESHLSLDTLAELMNAQLANKPMDIDGRTLLISNTRLYGNGERAVLRLDLEKPVKATIHVLARPVYDELNNTLYLDDIDYTLDTRNLLARSASWLMSDTFRKTIAEQGRIAFDSDLPKLLGDQSSLQTSLTPNLTMAGKLERLRPVSLYFSPEALHVWLQADGALGLTLK